MAEGVLGRLAGGVVVVVGDVMLDRFVYGDIERISPEAPVPVLRRGRSTQMAGGAGNVAANVASLGGRPRLVSVLGDDADGRELQVLLAGAGLPTDGLLADPGRHTAVKTRLIAQRQQVLRLDAESLGPLAAALAARLEAAFAQALEGAHAVILSDYGKGVLEGGVAERLIARARAAGAPVLVDPKGRDYARYAGADHLTPNRRELAEASGLPADTDAEVEAAARALMARHALGAVVATRSEKGLSVVRPDRALHVPTQAREVFDVSGAGDTVAAALALALAGGAELEEAADLANVAAGVAVAKLGTAQVTAGELAEALHARDPGGGEEAGAELLLAEWRRRGLTVGFTNGCFDLLHAGHVSYLAWARARCDRLVVGLNDDGSVRRLKGEARPINPLEDRRRVLEALRSVDLVVPFAEDTPELLIRRVAPDVLVKGADYREADVVGVEFVRARGGRVELAPLVAGRSTTAMAARAAGRS